MEYSIVAFGPTGVVSIEFGVGSDAGNFPPGVTAETVANQIFDFMATTYGSTSINGSRTRTVTDALPITETTNATD